MFSKTRVLNLLGTWDPLTEDPLILIIIAPWENKDISLFSIQSLYQP